ncbi:MAG: hypothetical protein K2X03_02100 [Bryobacteraceae bacterium]|nr:hypothetical protein [Bryobacteraceae bacterium]
MAKRDFQEVVSALRRDVKQQARQRALIAPWHRIEEASALYVDGLVFSLWIRAVCSVCPRVPSSIQTMLESKCAGFLDEAHEVWQEGHVAVWRRLKEWIECQRFADAKQEGWFEAVLYYAYLDLRTEQTWLHWDSTMELWQNQPPARVPTFETWQREIVTHAAALDRTDLKGVALQQETQVERKVLAAAADALIEARARALWIACCCKPGRVLPNCVTEELAQSIPSLAGAPLAWSRSLFIQVVRRAAAPWIVRGRSGRWSTALWYDVVNHPRYHRIVHYFHKCEDERLASGSQHSTSTFADWLRAADGFCLLTSGPSAGSGHC